MDQGFITLCVGWNPQLKTSSNCIHYTINSPTVEFFVLVPHTGVRRVHKWRSAHCPPVADKVGRENFPVVP